MTESRNGPKGFIIVLPGEIIEIPQDDDKSWLTLFYALPKELSYKEISSMASSAFVHIK